MHLSSGNSRRVYSCILGIMGAGSLAYASTLGVYSVVGFRHKLRSPNFHVWLWRSLRDFTRLNDANFFHTKPKLKAN